MDKQKNVFFIIGCGRSGTTALAKVLNACENGLVEIESAPKLCVAARSRRNGTLSYPKEFIEKSTTGKVERALEKHGVYGDKNPNYLYFTEELYDAYGCKFVFITRDGRDVVRSCMDFDRYKTPNYRRYEDDTASTLTQPEDDFWDYARLRPLPGESDFEHWKDYSKFEKFCWYWANYNRLILEKTERLPKECWRIIDMSSAGTPEIKGLFDFLGLEPFKESVVDKLLHSKINTNEYQAEEPFPAWQHWTKEETEIFLKHAAKTMKRLGYL